MSDNPLGKDIEYVDEYSPELLFPVPRQIGREGLGIGAGLPFSGVDIWNAYELSWLNAKGKPVAAVGEFRFPIDAANIVESKSLKLYLNSLNSMRYESSEAVEGLVQRDLRNLCEADVEVRFWPVASAPVPVTADPAGSCIDELDIEASVYDVDPDLLEHSTEAGNKVSETLYSHLLRSRCPVTGQPDWASVFVTYQGDRIHPDALLKYLISFRNHDEFHEHCVERIFMDISRHCQPEDLTVYARYTRRGGLDINPFRSSAEDPPDNVRLSRQ